MANLDQLDRLRSGELAGAQRLDLRAGLTDIPREVYALADTLEILDLSGNALSQLPDELERLHRLRIIFASDNQFRALPTVLGRMPQLSLIGFRGNQISHVSPAALPQTLQWLILTDNQLTTLPDDLGACARLQKCALAGNQLATLPAAMANCHRLELLRISANNFAALPAWLADLPRLAWLAFGGNPLTAGAEARVGSDEETNAPLTAWANIAVGEPLGSGASGVVYRAQRQGPSGEHEAVALKLFKGGLTSDGWSSSEIAAARVVGSHPQVIGINGVLTGHPAGTAGLTMPLLDGRFQRLADPPSFATCTRDVYAADVTFPLAVTTRLARGIADAVAHLHARGLLHGDLYAHNVLSDRATGDARLGDFGAASFMPAGDLGLRLQQIEMRAFGCLLEELLARTVASAEDLADGWRLQRRCVAPIVADRPSFAEVAAQIQSTAFG